MFAVNDYKIDKNLLEQKLRSFDYDGDLQANSPLVIIDDSVRLMLWLYSIYCAVKILGLYFKKSDFDVT